MESLERKTNRNPHNNSYFAFYRAVPYNINFMVGAAHPTKSYLLGAALPSLQQKMSPQNISSTKHESGKTRVQQNMSSAKRNFHKLSIKQNPGCFILKS